MVTSTIQYQRILVPLDGSAMAEAAVAHAVHLASLEHATLTLLYVINSLDEIRGIGGQIVSIDELWEARRVAALEYLHSVQARPELREATVGVAIETGPIAERIVAFAAREEYDVIVISAHGYSGFKRWILGSVADRILRTSDCPVFLVNTNSSGRSGSVGGAVGEPIS